MFVIEREDKAYGCYEEDPGPEEYIQYKGRLLRRTACQQPEPVMAPEEPSSPAMARAPAACTCSAPDRS